MIVITGATGALNGASADNLLQRVPTGDVVVAVRDPSKAQRFADRGVTVRHATTPTPTPYPALSTAPTRYSWCPPVTRVPTL